MERGDDRRYNRSMNIDIVDLPQTAAASPAAVVVVIDVLRAATTAAAAFQAGASAIIPVSKVREGLELRDRLDGSVTIGEVDGHAVDEFDLPNSPSIVAGEDLTGRIIVHRTTAGTQGLLHGDAAQLLLMAGFANASATCARVRAEGSARVVLVVTGSRSADRGDEDRACAEYLARTLEGTAPDATQFLERVRASAAAQRFAPGGDLVAYAEDVERCTALDTAAFAMVTEDIDGLRGLRARPSS